MLSESDILKSLGLSAFWSALLIGLAIYLEWDLIDLAKCFYILVMMSTLYALLMVLLTVGNSINILTNPSDPSEENQSKYVLTGQKMESKNIQKFSEMSPVWKIIFAIFVLLAFYFLAHEISEVGDLFYTSLAGAIEGWPRAIEKRGRFDLLFQTTTEYLPFALLLLANLSWDAFRKFKIEKRRELSDGLVIEFLGYVCLLPTLGIIILFLPMILNQSELYYGLLVLTFLPYSNFISLAARARGGY